jgi:mRNA-degrading endonuclease YafQ of YafQ-DinJ toxin-antitoxin module
LTIVITESFKHDYQSFIKGKTALEKRMRNYIDLLKNGRQCSGMNLEKIKGFDIKGLKSVRLNDEMRMSVIIADKIFLLRINHHDNLYKTPL